MSKQEQGVLAIGSGSMLDSLVKTWHEAGDFTLTVCTTDTETPDHVAFTVYQESNEQGRLTSNVTMKAERRDLKQDWCSIIRPYRFILYAAQLENLAEWRDLQDACELEGKPLLPAITLRGVGLVGPLLDVDGSARPEAVWRSLHPTVFRSENEQQSYSFSALYILTNLVVHEYHREVSAGREGNCRDQCYILDPNSLTGSWHSIRSHLFDVERGSKAACRISTVDEVITARYERMNESDWYTSFADMTSSSIGIFHKWEEAGIVQLPLAQCMVQPIDPASESFVRILPAIMCSGLTHEEARRESGLAGLEAYAARILPFLFPVSGNDHVAAIAVGAGCEAAEAVGRGIRACLTKRLQDRIDHSRHGASQMIVSRLRYEHVADSRCQYYLQSLCIMGDESIIAVGEPLLGYPVVWVYSRNNWYGSVDVDFTIALRHSLQKALNQVEGHTSDLFLVQCEEENSMDTVMFPHIPYPFTSAYWIATVQRVLEKNKKDDSCLEIYDLHSSSFLSTEAFFVCGVRLREEGST